MRRVLLPLGFALALQVGAPAAADRPLNGPIPSWVRPAAAELPSVAGSDTAVLVLLHDQQVRFSPREVEFFAETRVRVQTPQGLAAAGTVSLAWQPDADTVTVHRLAVRRGKQVRDLLAGGEGFTILRREDMLEQATLTGTLTAVMQPPDLQVGDVLEFAYTLKHADPVIPELPDREFAWPNARMHNIRFRAQWPKEMAVRWRLRDFQPVVQESSDESNHSMGFELATAEPLLQPTGAPSRFQALRRAEFTTFESWAQVSQRFAPLYARAATLPPGSPLRAEIERIRKAHRDPKSRATAALRLVQDQVRYVLLAMNDGALMPATADQTWERRYGDCKAKTALLLAMLQGLGIDAQPVAVNSTMGDGVEGQFPGISAFDHVLIRMVLAGKTYWLDGTRLGDRELDRVPVPDFGWGLPLLAKGSALVKIQPAPLEEPQVVHEIRLDASAGLDLPARLSALARFRGDSALAVKMAQDNMDAGQREQGMRSYWRSRLEDAEIDQVDARFDEQSGELVWSATGTSKMDWDGDSYEPSDMRLGFRADFTRPRGTDASAPYALSYPEYSLSREVVVLPPQRSPFTISGRDIDQTISGMQFRRKASLAGNTFTAEAAFRTLAPEFPASEAPQVSTALRDMFRLGLSLKKPPRYTPTAAELQQEVERPATTAGEFIDRGNKLIDQGKYDEAVAALDRAIGLDPKSDLAYADRGIAQINRRQFDAARADLRHSLELKPDNYVAQRGMGSLALEEKRYAEAIDWFSRSLRQDENRFAFNRRARSYAMLKQYDLALADLEQVSRGWPDEPTSYLERARLVMEARRASEIPRIATEVLATDMGIAQAATTAAEVYLMGGERDRARAVLDDAIAKEPGEALYLRRALTHRDPAAARSDVDKALQSNPDSIPALVMRATIENALKQFSSVLKTTERIEALGGTSSSVLWMRGDALYRQGDQALASSAFSRARELAGGSMSLNNECWRKATQNIALDEALKDCDAALALQPDCAACLDSRGFVLLRLGRLEDAISAYDAALKATPNLPHSLFGRGLAKQRAGRQQEGEADMAAAKSAEARIETVFEAYGMLPGKPQP